MANRHEALLERKVLALLGRDRDLAIFRNECGEGFYARVKPLIVAMCGGVDAKLAREVATVFDRNRVHFGLHNGSADLVGIDAAQGGRFVSIELKSATGYVMAAQENWLERMHALGAVAVIVRTPEEAVQAIERTRQARRIIGG